MRIIVSILVLLVLAPASVSAASELSALQEQLFLLIQQVVRLQAELNTAQKISNLPCYTLTRDLRFGDSGDEVAGLHKALKQEGFDFGTEESSRYFGEKTAAAVVAFQQKYAEDVLKPIGLTYGTGYFGKLTRDKVNEIYGCGAKPLNLTSTPLPPSKTTPPPYCNIEAVSGKNRLEGCMWTNSSAPLQGVQAGPAPQGNQFNGYIRSTGAAISFRWNKEALKNNFSNRWKGEFLFDRGDYRFVLGTDDKASFWINDSLQSSISNGGVYSSSSVVVNVKEASTLKIQVDHIQDTGEAIIIFGWERI